LNGHHWAQQQLRHAGIAFESLDNGFRWCENPARLQAVCDALGPSDVQAFFDRWVERLPWPLRSVDRAAGYRHRLSLWQVEVSLTHIFREPVYGRRWFEAILRENLDLGRPDRVSLLFPTRMTRATPPPKRGYRTRVITAGVTPTLHVSFKHSDLKQYFKGCGIRTETTFNDPTDVQRTKGSRRCHTYARSAAASTSASWIPSASATVSPCPHPWWIASSSPSARPAGA